MPTSPPREIIVTRLTFPYCEWGMCDTAATHLVAVKGLHIARKFCELHAVEARPHYEAMIRKDLRARRKEGTNK